MRVLDEFAHYKHTNSNLIKIGNQVAVIYTQKIFLWEDALYISDGSAHMFSFGKIIFIVKRIQVSTPKIFPFYS